MPLKRSLLGSFITSPKADAITGTITNNLTAAGSTQTTALNLTDAINVITTTAASTGVMVFPVPVAFSVGDTQQVYNHGANTLTVYPPVGYKISTGSTNAGVSVAAGKAANFQMLDSTTIGVIISA